MPGMPPDLDDDAKKYWKKFAPMLNRIGILTEADGEVFGIMCQIRSRIQKIHRVLETEPYTQEKHTVDGAGQEHTELKKNPFIMMEQEYYKLFRAYASEFGLTPSSRSRLSTTKPEEDRLDKFFDRK